MVLVRWQAMELARMQNFIIRKHWPWTVSTTFSMSPTTQRMQLVNSRQLVTSFIPFLRRLNYCVLNELKISGVVTEISGSRSGQSGFVDGPMTSAKFSGLYGISCDTSFVYIAGMFCPMLGIQIFWKNEFYVRLFQTRATMQSEWLALLELDLLHELAVVQPRAQECQDMSTEVGRPFDLRTRIPWPSIRGHSSCRIMATVWYDRYNLVSRYFWMWFNVSCVSWGHQFRFKCFKWLEHFSIQYSACSV